MSRVLKGEELGCGVIDRGDGVYPPDRDVQWIRDPETGRTRIVWPDGISREATSVESVLIDRIGLTSERLEASTISRRRGTAKVSSDIDKGSVSQG